MRFQYSLQPNTHLPSSVFIEPKEKNYLASHPTLTSSSTKPNPLSISTSPPSKKQFTFKNTNFSSDETLVYRPVNRPATILPVNIANYDITNKKTPIFPRVQAPSFGK